MTQNLHCFYYVQTSVCIVLLSNSKLHVRQMLFKSGSNYQVNLWYKPAHNSQKKTLSQCFFYMCRKAKHQTSPCLCWRSFCYWSMAQCNTRCLMSLHYEDKGNSPASHNRFDRSWVIFRSLSHLCCSLASLELEDYCYYIQRLIITTRMSLRSTALLQPTNRGRGRILLK